jgi:hypothetical protein
LAFIALRVPIVTFFLDVVGADGVVDIEVSLRDGGRTQRGR